MTLHDLMFRREHFPIILDEVTEYNKGKTYWDFATVVIPPYHPSMREKGINFESVPNLLYETVGETVNDLEEIADKREDIKLILHDITRSRTGLILFKPQIIEQGDLGIMIDSVPIIDHFYVGKKEINPYRFGGDQGIAIHPELGEESFSVPERVSFTPELMKEYEMTECSVFLGEKLIQCPNGWYRHNLETINAIFYRNLIIALDNSIVRKSYIKDEKKAR